MHQYVVLQVSDSMYWLRNGTKSLYSKFTCIDKNNIYHEYIPFLYLYQHHLYSSVIDSNMLYALLTKITCYLP